MRKQRDHVLEIVYLTFRRIKDHIYPLLGMILSTIHGHQSWKNWIHIGFYALCSYIVIHAALAWWNKTYTIEHDCITVTEGVFHRKQMSIPISRVRSIHTGDSIIKRLFGISDLHVEILGSEAVTFVLPNRSIANLRQTVFHAYEVQKIHAKQEHFSFKEYIMLSTASSGIYSASFAILMPVLSFLAGGKKKDLPIQESLTKVLHIPPTGWGALVATTIAVLLLNVIPTMALVYATYRNFTIERTGEQITMQYGLLHKKHIAVPVKHIRSIRVQDNWFLQVFGYVKVKLDIIGFDKDKKTSVRLFPMIHRDQLPQKLEQMLPEFQFVASSHRAGKNVRSWYMIRYAMWWSAFILMCAHFFSFLYYGCIGSIIFLALGYRQWRYAGIGWNKEFLSYSFGALFSTTTMIVKKEYVETTSLRRNFFSKRKRAVDYGFALYSEKLVEYYEVCRLPDTVQVEFASYVLEDR